MKPGGRLAARRALKEQEAQRDSRGPGETTPTQSLVFPAALSAAQRARLHEVAEEAGLAHASSGEGASRVLTLGSGPPLLLTTDAASVSDDLLAQWVQTHLGVTYAAQPVKQAGGGRPSPSSPSVSVEAFVATTHRLLDLEHAAELASGEAVLSAGVEAAVALGVCVRNLRVTDASPGFLGRTVLTFTLRGQSDVPLPDHKLGVHDIVAVRPSAGATNEAPLARGIVCRLTDSQLSVALDDAPEGCEGPLRVERLANDVTHTRLKATLTALQAAQAGSGPPAPGARLVDLLFGRSAPLPVVSPPPLKPLNGDLDASQVKAVAFALAAPELALIWGPPGTGKTTALVELILQAIARGERVLATAASNVAVDNLVERLRAASPKLRCVRLGHPARLAPAVVDACLDACVAKADSSQLAADVRKERKALTARLLKLGPRDASERRDVRRQLAQLAKEERQRTHAAVGEVLDAAQVTAATLTGAMGRTLGRGRPPFDLVVIDEAAQALEVACWGPLLLGRKAVLAGDHMQLPPTVLCDAAAAGGLSATLFERAHAAHPSLCRMLTVQYRMNAAIADWASGELYDHQLTAPPAVATRTLADLCAGAADLPVLLHIDTAGCDMEEDEAEGGAASAESKRNPGEADVAVAHVRRLLDAGLLAAQVGIISPYSAQVQLLRELRSAGGHRLAGVEISTVDGFQGREMEALVISCVRSNSDGNVGFLADVRRMNVAVTRARRHCALVGDSETLRRSPFLGRLCDWLEAHGEVRSAAEYT